MSGLQSLLCGSTSSAKIALHCLQLLQQTRKWIVLLLATSCQSDLPKLYWSAAPTISSQVLSYYYFHMDACQPVT